MRSIDLNSFWRKFAGVLDKTILLAPERGIPFRLFSFFILVCDTINLEVIFMRLMKVQKALQRKSIKYEYEEIHGLARLHFIENGTVYTVDELRGNKDKSSTTGIWTNIDGLGNRGTQDRIVVFIKTIKS